MNLEDLEEAISSSGITGGDVAVAVLLLAIGVGAYLLVGRLLRRGFERTPSVAPELAEIATRVLQFVVLWVFIALALQVLGANAGWLSFLLIGLLAVGAFTAKPLLDGMVSSVAVAAHSAINVGEDIDVDGIRGTVEGLERRSTVIRTPDGVRVYLPNSEVVDATVTVLTAEPERQSTIEFTVDPALDLDELDRTLQAAIPSTPHVTRLEGVRIAALERGIRVEVVFSHDSTLSEEAAAIDAVNRTVASALADLDIDLLR